MRITLFEHVTVDGVMQAPGRADEIAATASSTAAGRRFGTRSSAASPRDVEIATYHGEPCDD